MVIMKSRIAVYLLVVIALSQANAQVADSYIVSDEGDTLYGEVSWFGDFFVTDKVALNKTEVPVDGLAIVSSRNGKFYQRKQDTLWVRLRVSGVLDLYQHKESFYAEKAGKFVWLENDQYEIGNYGYSKVKTTHRYRKILNYLMSDCGDFQKELSNLKYKEKAMIQILEAYHLCQGEPYQVR